MLSLLLAAFLASLPGQLPAVDGGSASPPADAGTGEPQSAADGGSATGALTRAPELLQFVPAAYPDEALKAGLSAEVGLTIDIGPEGQVTGVQVAAPAGHGFDEAALAAVKAFRFRPAEIDGQPAAVQIEYRYHFTPELPKVEAPDGGAAPPEPKPTLQGIIKERGTRRPLPGASVWAEADSAQVVLSDEQGRFSLALAAGAHRVHVKEAEHLEFATAEAVVEGNQTEVVYYLERRPDPRAFETVVRGRREKKEVTVRTLQGEELTRVPGTFGDPLRVIQALPGVARPPFILGQMIVRGASPDSTGFVFDDQTVPLLYHFGAGPEVINPNFIDRIDFYPGAYPAKYGRYTAGLVSVGSKPGRTDRWHGSLNLNFFDSGAVLEVPVLDQKATLSFAGRRSYVDQLLKIAAPDNVAPIYWDYQGRFDYAPTPRDRIKVFSFGSDDTLSQPAQPSDDPTQPQPAKTLLSARFHRAQASWRRQLGPDAALSTSVGFGYDKAGFDFGPTRFDLSNYSFIGRTEIALPLTSYATGTAGLDANVLHYQGQVFGNAAQASTTLTLSRPMPMFGAYADLGLKPVQGLLIVPALRADNFHYQGRDRTSADPRLSARYELGEGFTFKGAAGVFHQPPSFQEWTSGLGNPDLRLSRSYQYSLGGEWAYGDDFDIDLQGFYNRLFDLTIRSGARVERDGKTVPEIYSSTGAGRAYGLELIVRKRLTGRLFGWVSYTLSRSERLDPNTGVYNLFQYDQPHILNAVASYRLPYDFEVGARFRLVSGNPSTPVVGTLFDADSMRYRPIYGAVNSERLPAFHELDLRVDKRFSFERWTLDLYLELLNVYNRKNPEFYFWSYDYTKRQTIDGLPFFPSLGMKADF